MSKLSCKRGESQFPRLELPQLAVGKSNIHFWFYLGLKSKSIPRRLWLGSNYNSGWFGKNSKQILRIRLKKKAVFYKIDNIYSFYIHLNAAYIKAWSIKITDFIVAIVQLENSCYTLMKNSLIEGSQLQCHSGEKAPFHLVLPCSPTVGRWGRDQRAEWHHRVLSFYREIWECDTSAAQVVCFCLPGVTSPTPLSSALIYGYLLLNLPHWRWHLWNFEASLLLTSNQSNSVNCPFINLTWKALRCL